MPGLMKICVGGAPLWASGLSRFKLFPLVGSFSASQVLWMFLLERTALPLVQVGVLQGEMLNDAFGNLCVSPRSGECTGVVEIDTLACVLELVPKF